MSQLHAFRTSTPNDGLQRHQPDWLERPLLLYLALSLVILVPLPIQYGLAPSLTRWLGDLVMMVMAGLALVRMFARDRIPQVMLLFLGLTMVGIVAAAFEGQTPMATAWGWWLMYKFPLIGLFAYLQPIWPPRAARLFISFCVGLLAVNTAVQVVQVLAGETLGDPTAGLFGWPGGTSYLVQFLVFVTCLALAEWLIYRRWRMLTFVLGLGICASILGEMKMYPILIAVLSVVVSIMYFLRGGRPTVVGRFLAIFMLFLGGFWWAYETIVVPYMPYAVPLETYFDLDNAEEYVTHWHYDRESGEYYIGRTLSVTYGWQTIQRDGTTTLFGMGIGARADNATLQAYGEAIRNGRFGVNRGSGTLVMLQELGVVGIAVFCLFLSALVVRFWRDSARDPASDETVLRLGLILFTLTWPFWIWYSDLWSFSLTPLLYWLAVGFLFNPYRNHAGRSHYPATRDWAETGWNVAHGSTVPR